MRAERALEAQGSFGRLTKRRTITADPFRQDPFGKSCLESDTEASGNEYNSDASSNFEEEEAFQDAGPGEATATGTGGGLTLVVGDGLLAMGDDGLDLSQECLSPGQAHTARRL
eukprot:958494-Rhodomonas_salina.2